MQTLTLFTTLSASAFTKATKLFTGKTASENYQLFCDYLANCVHKYVEHKDATHLQNALEASKYRNMYRVIKPFLTELSAHDLSKKDSKMDKTKMEQLHNVNDDNVLEWEAKLYSMLVAVSAKQAENEDVTAKKFDNKRAESQLKSLFNKAGNSGMSLDDLDKIYFQVRASFEVSKLKVAA